MPDILRRFASSSDTGRFLPLHEPQGPMAARWLCQKVLSMENRFEQGLISRQFMVEGKEFITSRGRGGYFRMRWNGNCGNLGVFGGSMWRIFWGYWGCFGGRLINGRDIVTCWGYLFAWGCWEDRGVWRKVEESWKIKTFWGVEKNFCLSVEEVLWFRCDRKIDAILEKWFSMY